MYMLSDLGLIIQGLRFQGFRTLWVVGVLFPALLLRGFEQVTVFVVLC